MTLLPTELGNKPHDTTYHKPKHQQACHTGPSATLQVTNTQVCQQNLYFTITHFVITSNYSRLNNHICTGHHSVSLLLTGFIS